MSDSMRDRAMRDAKRLRNEKLAIASKASVDQLADMNGESFLTIYKLMYEKVCELEVKIEEQQEALDSQTDKFKELSRTNENLKKAINKSEEKITVQQQEINCQREIINQISKMNDELEKRVDKLENESENKRMEVETSGEITKINNWSEILFKKKHNLSLEQRDAQQKQIKVVNTLASEINERERRKKNVIIFGLAEPSNVNQDEKIKADEVKVKSLINELEDKVHVKRITRLKTKINTNKPSAIIIELENERERNSLLFNAKKLKNHNFYKNVFLSIDMTLSEREKFNELRNEAKKRNSTENNNNTYWVVRNDRLVQFKQKQ